MYPARMGAPEFGLIARAIFETVGLEPEARLAVTQAFADRLPATNSQFDRARFVHAALTGENIRPAPRVRAGR